MLVQDYHLCLVAAHLRDRRPDLRCVHFSHTPFAPPVWLGALPAERGAGAARRARRPPRAAGSTPSAGPTTSRPPPATLAGLEPRTFVSPLASDPDDIRAVAASAECARGAGGARGSGSATAPSSDGSTGWSCPRTSCGGSSPTTSCSRRIPSTGVRWCSWPAPTPPASGRARATPSYREDIERAVTPSTNGGEPTTGSRSCSTSTTTTRGRWPSSGGPTCSW